MCLVFIATGPWLIYRGRTGRRADPFLECAYLIGICFCFAITFAIVDIDPIRPAMPLTIRYLMPALPFAAIFTVYSLSRLGPKLGRTVYPKAERVGSIVIASIMLVWPTARIEFFSNKFAAFFWSADRQYSEFAEMFSRGELILTGKKMHAHRMIAQFRVPVTTRISSSYIHAIPLLPSAQCLDKLEKAPLSSNYHACKSREHFER